MTNFDLNRDIEILAGALAELAPELETIISGLMDIHYAPLHADGLDMRLTTLVGEDSVLTLIALILEAKADSKPVRELPEGERAATRRDLISVSADLMDVTNSNTAERVAYTLNPA